MGREQACQLVSFLAGQLGAYDGRSGRLMILLRHNIMITGRSPSYRDQHAETRLIRNVTPPRAPETALPGHEVRLPYEEVVLLSNITVGETAAATVVVAAFAIGQSIWTTLRTGRASREDRLWQRRAEVYVDLLTWAIRQRELSTITPAEWLSEIGRA